MDDEFIDIISIKNVVLLNVLIEILKNHDKGDTLLFGTKDIILGRTFKIRVNGELAFSFGDILEDGDMIEIHPVLEGEEYE